MSMSPSWSSCPPLTQLTVLWPRDLVDYRKERYPHAGEPFTVPGQGRLASSEKHNTASVSPPPLQLPPRVWITPETARAAQPHPRSKRHLPLSLPDFHWEPCSTAQRSGGNPSHPQEDIPSAKGRRLLPALRGWKPGERPRSGLLVLGKGHPEGMKG